MQADVTSDKMTDDRGGGQKVIGDGDRDQPVRFLRGPEVGCSRADELCQDKKFTSPRVNLVAAD